MFPSQVRCTGLHVALLVIRDMARTAVFMSVRQGSSPAAACGSGYGVIVLRVS